MHWGEFVAVSAAMEHRGVPINMEIASLLLDKDAWAYVRDAIVPRINPQYGVYVQDAAGEWSFSTALFEAYCARAGISWPRHEGPASSTFASKTFDSMAKAYPETEAAAPAAPRPQQDAARSSWRSAPTGAIERCCGRSPPRPGARSRKPPSGFSAPAVWLRSLIKPEPGRALAYIDWSGMEFQIAAALSNCKPMLDLYASGSPYIGFAKRFDEAPPDATKKSHPHIHERYKVGCLGAQYSMQHVTLAQRLGISTFAAHEMLSQHRGLFSKYWAWVEDWIAHALNTGEMRTRDGLDLPHRHHRIQRALDRQLAGAGDRRRHLADCLHRGPPARPAAVRIGPRRGADRKLAGADRRRRGADARDHAAGLARRARRLTSCEPASTSSAIRTAITTPAASRCGPKCWNCWSSTGA